MNRALKEAINAASLSGSRAIDLREISLDQFEESMDELRGFDSIRLGGRFLDFLPEAFFELEQVSSLYIENSAIKQIPSAIGDLTRLHGLYITCCPNLRALPDEIQSASCLETLFLVKNGIDVLSASVGKLPLLRRLVVVENALFRIPDFPESSSIVELNLSGNNLCEIPISLYSMQQLQVLNLSGNRISEDFSGSKRFQRVSWLSLSKNNLRRMTSGVVWDTLVELDLSSNSLCEIPKILCRFPRLKLLNLTGNFGLTREDCEEFQRALLRVRPDFPVITIFQDPVA